jgi:hypothetical protein
MERNKSTNVLLVESHKRTISWAKALLTLNQVNLHVLVVMPDEKKVYLDLGVNSDNIHDIKDISDSNNKETNIESNLYCYFNAIIASDRLLSKKKYEKSLSYLVNLFNFFNKVLGENNIETIILEPTWAHEILICEAAKMQEIKTYFPHTMRIPYNHFLFFNGYQQDSFFKRNKSEFSNSTALDAYNNIVKKGEKPFYFYKNNDKNTFSPKLLSKPFTGLAKELSGERNLNVTPKVYNLIIDKVAKIIRKRGMFFLVDFSQPKNKEKYIF